MKLLALETSDRIASIAYYCDGLVRSASLDGSLRHAETVLPAVDELLNDNGITLGELDALVVDVGPGSFTGVRIGVTIANALASAVAKPVIAVNSLEALAQPYRSEGRACAVIIDARNGNGYAALYKGDACLIEPCACVIEEFMNKLSKDCIQIGTGTDDKRLPSAEQLVLCALNKEGCKTATPLYLRPSQAERMWRDK